MPRQRVYKPTTPVRYQSKVYATFIGRGVPEDMARSVAVSAAAEWAIRFGGYRERWNAVLKKLPQGLLSRIEIGLYRAAFFKMAKAADRGEDVMDIINSLVKKGYDQSKLIEIARAAGLIEASQG